MKLITKQSAAKEIAVTADEIAKCFADAAVGDKATILDAIGWEIKDKPLGTLRDLLGIDGKNFIKKLQTQKIEEAAEVFANCGSSERGKLLNLLGARLQEREMENTCKFLDNYGEFFVRILCNAGANKRRQENLLTEFTNLLERAKTNG